VAAPILIAFLIACGPSSPPEPFHGTWKVTSVLAPGVSAPPGGAVPVGTEVSFEADEAAFGARSCDEPAYTRRSLSFQTFTEAYRVAPDQLSLTAEPVGMVDLSCGNGSLEAGSTLILRPDGSMLTMWDGVFYELKKQPD
jgi:hypothetical protein